MYIAELFNNNNLFQYLGGWFKDTKVSFFSGFMKSNVKDFSKVWDSWKQNVQIFEVLLGFATSTILNLNQIKYLERRCISQFNSLESKLNMSENRIIFWSHKLVNLLSKIPPVISTIRIMENLLLELIGKRIKHPMPKNLFILIKNGHDSYEFIPIELWNILESYWIQTGSSLRAYKKLHQYLFSLTSHSYFEKSPKEKIMILLPDNPEIEDFRKFTYELQVDAIRFLENAFDHFHNLVEKVSDYFKYEPSLILQGWSFIDYEYLPAKQGTVALVIKNPERGKGIEVINEGGKPLFNKVSMDEEDEEEEDDFAL
jgi:hypothetical protein